MAKLVLSTNQDAIRSRLRRLPKLVNDAMDAQTRKDIDAVIREYKNGIRRNNFGLAPLNPVTVQRKTDQGYPRPRTPLYGQGEQKKNSLMNALGVRKIKNGYRLYFRRAKHHASNLSLSDLLTIMTNGALIRVTPRMRAFLHFIGIHLKKTTTIIRIPPRPVVDRAIKRALKKKKAGEPTATVRRAVNVLLKTGDDRELLRLAKYKAREGLEK